MSSVQVKVKEKIPKVHQKHQALADEILADVKSGKPRTATELMESVGYSRSTALKQQKRAMTSEGLRQCLEERGLGPERVQRVLDDAMGANTVVVFKGTARETDAPDHKTRLAATSLLGDFMGLKKTVVETRNLNVSMDADILREILGMKTAKPSEENA